MTTLLILALGGIVKNGGDGVTLQNAMFQQRLSKQSVRNRITDKSVTCGIISFLHPLIDAFRDGMVCTDQFSPCDAVAKQ